MSNTTKRSQSLETRIQELSPEKRAIFEKLSSSSSESARRAVALTPRRVSSPAPLSFAQQRLWFLEQLMPGTTVFNLSGAIRIGEAFDEEVLERSVNEIVRRHESLRTTFKEVNGEPVSEILPHLWIELRSVDLRSLPEAERADEAERLLAAAGGEPFDFATGPLLRTLLVRIGDEGYVFLVVMHHIVSDAWSLDIFWTELSMVWDCFAAGESSPLPELPLQYADFAVWERDWLSGPVLAELVSYWKGQLADLPVVELPTDWPRPPVPSGRGAVHYVTVPGSVTSALKALGRQEGATLFMVLLAGFQTLLCRYTGEEDVVVGTYTANRDRAEIESLIGFFVNALVLRADLSGRPTFRELLRQVRRTALDAYSHQDLPFARLIRELAPERDLSRNPLFQVAFQLLNTPGIEDEAESSDPIVDLERTTAVLDLTCTILETGESLGVEFEYSTDLFAPDTIEALGEHYVTLLTAAAAEPDARAHELPLVGDDVRRRAVEEWNRTAVPYPDGESIVSLFESQVARTPDAAAFRCSGTTTTYDELNRRANRLARHLRGLGVRAEIRVGICMERSIDMVIALLAVFKAGGAYVPLEPGLPRERLERIADDARLDVVLTQRRFLARIPRTRARVVDVDTLAGTGESTENLGETVPASVLAYVIYTSGSTGRPKGVAIEHRQLLNRLRWMWGAYPFADGEVSCQKTALSFVDSFWELLGPLLQGVPTVIVPDELVTDVGAFVDTLGREQVTRILLVPSLLRSLLEAFPDLGRRLPHLHFWVTSGEPLAAELAELFEERLPGSVLCNLYGASEAWDATWYDPRRDRLQRRRVPIGRPIANVRVYVLDAHDQPVPPGVPGELHVGGVGLARGYLNDPAQTAVKFVPDPFAPEPGARLYRTGDLARYRADGNIEFLGRRDNQVKLRGFRIELGEIEAALGLHPTVRHAVAVVRDDDPVEPRLVAYLVRHPDDRTPDEAYSVELRRYLRRTLPEYMIPGAFVTLLALPLTAAGKVNRRALPAPDRALSPARRYVAPRTPVETEVAAIWGQLLGVERVGIHDSFFDLGGHSLLGIRALTRVRDAFDVEIPFSAIFETPTVAGLAERIAAAQARGARRAVALTPRRVSSPAPLSFAQQRLWFLEQLMPGTTVFNLSGAIRIGEAFDEEVLERSVNEIVRRHESLRTTFKEVNGEPVSEILPHLWIELRSVDLRSLPEAERADEAERLLAAAGGEPFDFATGPLLRTLLVRIGDEGYVFLVVMHHIVSDAWSLDIFWTELSMVWDCFAAGESSPLPELPLQYADFAVWERDWLSGPVLAELVSYWKGQLADLPVVELPTDWPRPPVPSGRGAVHYVTVPGSVTSALKALGRQEGATLFMVLLAGFQTLLCRYTGEEDVVVGTYTANRDRAEIESLIGFFVNALVLRADLSGRPTFRELLRQVRRTALDAYSHQDLPFARLIRELAPERDLSRNPLFQVAFQLLNTPGIEDEAESSDPIVDLERTTAVLDLTCTILETGESLGVEFEYSTDLFAPDTIEALGEHYVTLLTAAAAEPDARAHELPLVGDDVRRRAVEEWNRTAVPYPDGESIVSLFESQVARTPDAAAFRCSGTTTTYDELNRRANRLARHLRGLGVRAEIRVGICMERSIDMVIALLAVFKAGGAYVPLEPGLPRERLERIADDARLDVVLTQRRFLARIPRTRARVVDVDTLAGTGESTENLGETVPASVLAYVIYTSGSTGRPKGVAIEHRQLLNRLRWMWGAYPFADGEVSCQKTALSFVDSFWELLGPLLQGVPTVIVPDELVTDVGAFVDTLGREQVTRILLVPSLLRSLLEAFPDLGRRLPHLHFWVTSGEPLAAELAELFEERLPGSVLCNLYGASEAWDATWYDPRRDRLQRRRVPIGRPIANVRVYVLDAHDQPVPPGVPGELHVGGVGLARGYLNDPAQTAVKFVPDPFAPEPGARLYRTGDLARYRADGNIEFLGRRDNQVKLRGFRIELGEIEAALGLHPTVRHAVAVVRDDDPVEPRLVAYLVRHPDDRTPDEAYSVELRRYLRRTLPEYMIPGAFVTLLALPLTAAGKVNRRALPAPDRALSPARRYVAPRTPVETEVAAIWGQLLGVERVGIHDSFFDLGGHSLLGIRALTRVRDAFDVEIPFSAIFETPTVAGLAERIAAAQARGTRDGAPPIAPLSRAEHTAIAILDGGELSLSDAPQP